MLLILRGATHGIGTTVRVFCYAYSPMIFGVVPVLGGLVGGIWMLVIAIIGLGAAHVPTVEAASGRAPAVPGLMGLLWCCVWRRSPRAPPSWA
jgi:hypothetical protein